MLDAGKIISRAANHIFDGIFNRRIRRRRRHRRDIIAPQVQSFRTSRIIIEKKAGILQLGLGEDEIGAPDGAKQAWQQLFAAVIGNR